MSCHSLNQTSHNHVLEESNARENLLATNSSTDYNNNNNNNNHCDYINCVDEYDDKDDCAFLDGYSSSSTAGPPPTSPENTGRYDRPPWNLAIARVTSSHGSSMSSSCATRTELSRETGRYSAHANDGSHTTHYAHHPITEHANHSSFMSTSPVGSSAPREWGRSFRLFNNNRYSPPLSMTRVRESFNGSALRNHSIIFKTASNRVNVANSDVDRSVLMSNSLSQLRQSGVASSHNASIHLLTRSPEIRGPSLSGAVTRNATPLPVSSSSSHYVSSPLTTSPRPYSLGATVTLSGTNVYALNASELIHGLLSGSAVGSLTTAQKELHLLFNALRSHLSVSGTTIIVGDHSHALEIKRGNLIGAGGYAKVFVGLNTITGELVAVKEIDIKDVDEIAALDAIEEEFGLIKSMRHPNIVSYHLFEHSKSQKVCRIVMELLAGDSTLKMLQKCGPLTETVLRKIARHLLNALSFIHKSGIFHRDVKPANILVSHRGEVKLCDFGCSKRLSELSKTCNYIIGTPVYMAPELIKGDADHKADIWSMACSLFELATGRLPWYHSNVKDNLSLMFYITTTTETPLAAICEDICTTFSANFIDFLEKCFERNVSKRPEASELLHHPWITTTSHTYFTSPELSLERTTEFVRISPPQSAHTSCGNSCSSLEFASKTVLELTVNKGSEEIELREHTLDLKDESATGKYLFTDTPTPAPAESVVSELNTAGCVNECAVDDEVLCQLELEEVSAVVAVDLCKYLMNAADTVFKTNLELTPMSNNAIIIDSMRGVSSPETTMNISHSLNPKWYTSVLSVGELSSLTMSPEHSLVYDNICEVQQKSNSHSDMSSHYANQLVTSIPQNACCSPCQHECGEIDGAVMHLEPTQAYTVTQTCSNLTEREEYRGREAQFLKINFSKNDSLSSAHNFKSEIVKGMLTSDREHEREIVLGSESDILKSSKLGNCHSDSEEKLPILDTSKCYQEQQQEELRREKQFEEFEEEEEEEEWELQEKQQVSNEIHEWSGRSGSEEKNNVKENCEMHNNKPLHCELNKEVLIGEEPEQVRSLSEKIPEENSALLLHGMSKKPKTELCQQQEHQPHQQYCTLQTSPDCESDEHEKCGECLSCECKENRGNGRREERKRKGDEREYIKKEKWESNLPVCEDKLPEKQLCQELEFQNENEYLMENNKQKELIYNNHKGQFPHEETEYEQKQESREQREIKELNSNRKEDRCNEEKTVIRKLPAASVQRLASQHSLLEQKPKSSASLFDSTEAVLNEVFDSMQANSPSMQFSLNSNVTVDADNVVDITTTISDSNVTTNTPLIPATNSASLHSIRSKHRSSPRTRSVSYVKSTEKAIQSPVAINDTLLPFLPNASILHNSKLSQFREDEKESLCYVLPICEGMDSKSHLRNSAKISGCHSNLLNTLPTKDHLQPIMVSTTTTAATTIEEKLQVGSSSPAPPPPSLLSSSRAEAKVPRMKIEERIDNTLPSVKKRLADEELFSSSNNKNNNNKQLHFPLELSEFKKETVSDEWKEEEISEKHLALAKGTNGEVNNYEQTPTNVLSDDDDVLHVSVEVDVGGNRRKSVMLNVNVKDVQRKMINNDVNYFVSFSDNIRNQIEQKICEIISSTGDTSQIISAHERTNMPNKEEDTSLDENTKHTDTFASTFTSSNDVYGLPSESSHTTCNLYTEEKKELYFNRNNNCAQKIVEEQSMCVSAINEIKKNEINASLNNTFESNLDKEADTREDLCPHKLSTLGAITHNQIAIKLLDITSDNSNVMIAETNSNYGGSANNIYEFDHNIIHEETEIVQNDMTLSQRTPKLENHSSNKKNGTIALSYVKHSNELHFQSSSEEEQRKHKKVVLPFL